MPCAEVFAYSPDIVSPDAIDDETRLDIFCERSVFGLGLEEQLFPGNLYVTRVARSDGTSAVGVYVDVFGGDISVITDNGQETNEVEIQPESTIYVHWKDLDEEE